MRAIYALLLICFLGIVIGSVNANNENVCSENGYGPPGYYQDDYPSSLNINVTKIELPVMYVATEVIPDLHTRYLPSWITLFEQPLILEKPYCYDPEVSYTYIGDNYNSTINVSNDYKNLYAAMRKSELSHFEYSMRL